MNPTYGGETITVYPDEPINPNAAVGGSSGVGDAPFNLPYHGSNDDGASQYPPTTGNPSGGSAFDSLWNTGMGVGSPSNPSDAAGTAGGAGSGMGSGSGSGSGTWPNLLGEIATRISVLLLGVLLLAIGLIWAMTD